MSVSPVSWSSPSVSSCLKTGQSGEKFEKNANKEQLELCSVLSAPPVCWSSIPVSSCFLPFPPVTSCFLLFQVLLFEESAEWRKVENSANKEQTALFCFVSAACLLVKSSCLLLYSPCSSPPVLSLSLKKSAEWRKVLRKALTGRRQSKQLCSVL